MTTTYTQTYTRTHTATYLTDVLMGTIGDMLGHLGIDASRLYLDWDRDERAISAWLLEGSLDTLVLECHQPGGRVSPVFEFPVSYDTSGRADEAFVNSRAAVARYRAKIDAVPRGTTFRLFCTFNGPRTPQPGWSPGTRASTAGLTSLSFGTVAEAPDARASMRYLR
jgi:hypothetical protein